jgi:penicillin-insensitive murein endopeptidase
LVDESRAREKAGVLGHVRPRRHRWRWRLLTLVAVAFLALRFGNTVAIAFESDAPSVSHGTPARGSLENGKRLPSRGGNFRAYSDLGTLLGRNAVHDRVRATVLTAYAELATRLPDRRFVYGETGWPSGGRFRPHRTHRNGMAVDFMVPVQNAHGEPAELPTHAFNRWGYDIEFDREGVADGLHIDYPAMAAHLHALADAAAAQGLRADVVIFDPLLQAALFAAPQGEALQRRMRFSREAAWVRHDEHYHVVFVPAD